MKKYVLSLLMLFGVITFSSNKCLIANAEERDNTTFANYLITEASSTDSEKVYVSSDIKPYVEELWISIYTETKTLGFMCHNYSGSFSMPSHAVRKAMVKGFTNYVLEMAGYAKFY